MENANKTWYYENGKFVGSELGAVNQTGLNLSIVANDQIGDFYTLLRQCDSQNKTRELTLDIHVL